MWSRTNDGRLINLALFAEIKVEERCDKDKFCVVGIGPNIRCYIDKFDTIIEAEARLAFLWYRLINLQTFVGSDGEFE